MQYYASGEAAWRVQHDLAQQAKRFERAVALGQQIERTRFESVRRAGGAVSAGRGLSRPGPDPPGRTVLPVSEPQRRPRRLVACAQGELQLADPKGRPLKPMLACVKAEARPHLDGRLDDPVWQQAKPAALQSAQHDDGDWPAAVMLAYDAEFLYMAVDCRQPPDAAAAPGSSRHVPSRCERKRDSPHCRRTAHGVCLLHRGRATPTSPRTTAWKCSSTSTAISPRTTAWPSIIAAGRTTAAGATPRGTPPGSSPSRQEKGRWTAEAAIPLAELTGRPPQPHDVWAVGIQRVVPGVGFQSWTTPAAVAVLPDGFGYLVFQ